MSEADDGDCFCDKRETFAVTGAFPSWDWRVTVSALTTWSSSKVLISRSQFYVRNKRVKLDWKRNMSYVFCEYKIEIKPCHALLLTTMNE
jgi:hypothetical protein